MPKRARSGKAFGEGASDNMSRCIFQSQWLVYSKRLPSISSAKRSNIQIFSLLAINGRGISSHAVAADEKGKTLLMGPLDNIMPRHHITPKALFIQASGSSQEEILKTLKSGLARTIEVIPSLAGHVKEALNSIPKGGMCVSGSFSTVGDILTAQDITESHPEMDYEDLKRRHFPMEAVDPNVIYSLPGFMDAEKPVFVAQANFIRGGLILGISLHHSFGDGASLKTILQTWAACCRGESAAPSLTESSQRERLTSSETGAILEDFPEYAMIPDNIAGYQPEVVKEESAEPAPMPPQVDSHVFYFSPQKLKELKKLASAKLDDTEWISTSDALSALFWRSITVARNPSSENTATEDTRVLNIPLDGRRLMREDSRSYMGNMVLFNNATAPLQTLLSSPPQLSEISRTIRRSISRIDESYIKRAISALGSVPDVSKVMMSGGTFGESALTISSWGSLHMDWGHVIGGPSECVRVSKIPFSGVCVVLAATESRERSTEAGGVEVMIGLKSDDMARLMKDPFFTSFAKWRCS